MKEGIYEVTNSGAVVAYARITANSFYITPIKLSGDALNRLVAGVQEGKLPDGYAMRERKQQQPAPNPKKPQWQEMTVNKAKSVRWAKRKALT